MDTGTTVTTTCPDCFGTGLAKVWCVTRDRFGHSRDVRVHDYCLCAEGRAVGQRFGFCQVRDYVNNTPGLARLADLRSDRARAVAS